MIHQTKIWICAVSQQHCRKHHFKIFSPMSNQFIKCIGLWLVIKELMNFCEGYWAVIETVAAHYVGIHRWILILIFIFCSLIYMVYCK